MKNKFSTFVEKGIFWIYALLSVSVAALCLLCQYTKYAYAKDFPLPNIVMAVIGIVLIAGLGLLMRKIAGTGFIKKADVFLIPGVSLILFVIMVIATHFYYFKTGWDAGIVV